MIKYDKSEKVSYSLGTQLTFYLLETHPEHVKKVYISPKQARDETYAKLVKLVREKRIPLIENNERIFKDLSGKDNVMVIGEFEKYALPLDPKANHVVLVNPSNMGNLGTILRCCVGFGVFDVAIITPAADVYDPKVIRASMGAFFHLRIATYKDFASYKLDAGEREIYPFMLQASRKPSEITPRGAYSLVYGNEATGLPASFLEEGTPLKIPQTPYIDSLNLDNAVAIGLYEFNRD